MVQFARFDDVGWSKPITVRRGEDLFVNWADFPTAAVFGDRSVALHLLRKASPNGYGYHVELSLSKDMGTSWTDPIAPYSDRSNQQHGFVTMSSNFDGSLIAAYRDRIVAEIRDVSVVRLLDGAWADPVYGHQEGLENFWVLSQWPGCHCARRACGSCLVLSGG